VTKQEKVKKIAPWIDPEERIAVDFRDEEGLNAVVTGCNAELVDLSMRDAYDSYETNSVPLSHTEVSEDVSHYTRDPERPLKHRRLMLIVNNTRLPIIY
jgi:hypothetical protein